MAAAAIPRLRGLVPPSLVLPSGEAADVLCCFVNGEASVVAITGAGLSTESGVPDYRSPQGSYSKGHKPLMHQAFVRSEPNRKRYWARSLIGWRWFAGAQPNAAHLALARLERIGWITGLITQNVDRLHARAGSLNVCELHGHNDEVECQSCSAAYPRRDFQAELEQVNKAWTDEWMELDDLSKVDLRADGDAHITASDFGGFEVPGCKVCGGVLKPAVVFFGGSIRRPVTERAMAMVMGADRLLVAGTSVQVMSSFRLVRAAAQAGKEVLIVNIGETRADELATAKIEARCGELLPLAVPAAVRGVPL